jgi:hypothetical protein
MVCIIYIIKQKEIPEKFIKVLKGETTIVPERSVTFNINDKLQLLNESNTTISPDKLKIKVIQRIFNVSSLSLIWQRWHLLFDKFIFLNLFCIIYIMETFPLKFFDLISNFDFL